ncbi:hypothetical protein ACFL6R_04585, partial [Gemmatimonadota bacterium]
MDPAENSPTGASLEPWLLDRIGDEGDLEPLARLGLTLPGEAARNLVRLGGGRSGSFWIDRAEFLGRGLADAPDPDLALT